MNAYPEQKPTIHRVEELDFSAQYCAADYWRFRFEEMVEIIRGKIFKMAPAPSSNHQRVQNKLNYRLNQALEQGDCEIFPAPFDVYLRRSGETFAEAQNIVQPDICVVCDAEKIKREGCLGAPDLVVEILSPGTRRKDLTVKKDLYEEFGVPELWVVSVPERLLLRFDLQGGSYRQSTFVEGQTVSSTRFQNLEIVLEEVFADIKEA
ncbi:MAG: Uma2 family endonuclease [Schleiferiaceae bacterium]|nr:Uma2 family endonuclease [Schleiferiaceae bacterium]